MITNHPEIYSWIRITKRKTIVANFPVQYLVYIDIKYIVGIEHRYKTNSTHTHTESRDLDSRLFWRHFCQIKSYERIDQSFIESSMKSKEYDIVRILSK